MSGVRLVKGMEALRIRLPNQCGYCEAERVVSFQASAAPGADELADWLEFKVVAARCPCLQNILWGVSHRGSRRKEVRYALDALRDSLSRESESLADEFDDLLEALQVALAGLRPRTTEGAP